MMTPFVHVYGLTNLGDDETTTRQSFDVFFVLPVLIFL